MIRLVPRNTTPDGTSLIGKYVLRESANMWLSCGRPRKVVSASKGKLTVDFVPIGMMDGVRNGKRGWCIDHRRELEDSPSGMMVSSVYAICDTLDDVVALMNHELDCQDAFDAMRSEARTALYALDGTTPPAASVKGDAP